MSRPSWLGPLICMNLVLAVFLLCPLPTLAQTDVCTRDYPDGVTVDRLRQRATNILDAQMAATTTTTASLARGLLSGIEQQQFSYRREIACYVGQSGVDLGILFDPPLLQAMEPDLQRTLSRLLQSAP